MASRGASSSGRGSSTKSSARSAISGQYVTKAYANKHPNTTVKETRKK